MKQSIKYFMCLIAFVLTLSLISCMAVGNRAGHPRVGGPVIEAPGACPDYSGIWMTNLGKMEFNQVGCRITGAGRISREYVDIQGEVTGGQFEFRWVGKNKSGEGYLVVDEPNDRIAGEYWVGPADGVGGGAITGQKRR
jgi:hypothetical protein